MEASGLKRLVIDLSALRGASQSAFSALEGEYELLLTDKLFIEFYTQKKKDEPLSRREAVRRAQKYFSNAGSVPSIYIPDPYGHEITNGTSAMEARHVRSKSTDLFLALPDPQQIDAMLQEKRTLARMFHFKHPRKFDAEFEALRRCRQDKALWTHITENLHRAEQTDWVRDYTLGYCLEYAKRRKWVVSGNFLPDRNWLTYGYTLAELVYIAWKYARYGDEVAEPSRPENPAYDLTYVAHMALADGLLSGDMTMRNAAWACWPDKRDEILTYDQEEQRIVRYTPAWEVE